MSRLRRLPIPALPAGAAIAIALGLAVGFFVGQHGSSGDEHDDGAPLPIPDSDASMENQTLVDGPPMEYVPTSTSGRDPTSSTPIPSPVTVYVTHTVNQPTRDRRVIDGVLPEITMTSIVISHSPTSSPTPSSTTTVPPTPTRTSR